MPDYQKIAVIGCGNVGATTAYTLMLSQLFNEIVLIDINEEKARSEAMDLNHCLPFLSPMQIYAGNYQQIRDCAIVILAAGVSQKSGETRPELLRRNEKVFRSIVERVISVNRDCILMIVSNPVDLLTYLSLKLSGFPPERVIGSGTVLDTARLKYLTGEKLGVDNRNVHTFIIGEHGDSELPVWSSANISGIDLKSYFPICRTCGTFEDLYGIFEYVKTSAYDIIEGKGATYYAIAQATLRIVQAIVKNENSILPVSAYLNGPYGLSDICLGVPCVIGQGGIRHVLEIPLDHDESRRLRESAEALRKLTEVPEFSR